MRTNIKSTDKITLLRKKCKLWQTWSNNQLTYVITLTENPNRLQDRYINI